MGLLYAVFLALLILGTTAWAIVRTVQSNATTVVKVVWIVLLLAFPVIVFLLWLLLGPR